MRASIEEKRESVSEFLPNVTLEGYISEQENSKDAAIASKLAAETYGLKIVKDDVQDMKHNTTRFLIMSKDLQQKKVEKWKQRLLVGFSIDLFNWVGLQLRELRK